MGKVVKVKPRRGTREYIVFEKQEYAVEWVIGNHSKAINLTVKAVEGCSGRVSIVTLNDDTQFEAPYGGLGLTVMTHIDEFNEHTRAELEEVTSHGQNTTVWCPTEGNLLWFVLVTCVVTVCIGNVRIENPNAAPISAGTVYVIIMCSFSIAYQFSSVISQAYNGTLYVWWRSNYMVRQRPFSCSFIFFCN